MQLAKLKKDYVVGWLVGFTAYQNLLGYLMQKAFLPAIIRF